MRRILVTGSRKWTDAATIENAISAALDGYDGDAVVVHGAAPGADTLAGEIAVRLGCWAEPHPYDRRRGKAGPKERNQKMVDLGADICLAFPLPDSRGTWDCVNRAKAARITVLVYAHPREP